MPNRKCPKGYTMINGVCQQTASSIPGSGLEPLVEDCCSGAQDAVSDCIAMSGPCEWGCGGSYLCDCHSVTWNFSMGDPQSGFWPGYQMCYYGPSSELTADVASCCGAGGRGGARGGGSGGRQGWGGRGRIGGRIKRRR